MSDLISRKWLTDAIRNRRTYLSYEDAKDVIDLIDNAPTVEPEKVLVANVTFDEDKLKEIVQDELTELTDEVWKLYKKHQSHLATYVLEFGEELADLLGKYNEGGAE